MSLQLIAALLGLMPTPCMGGPGRQAAHFTGSVLAGHAFERPFGTRFVFELAPGDYGWRILIREQGREENLAGLTPPWHFVPNPTDLEGWHFRNRDNTGPNDGGVNAPQEVREFVFSPQVGRSLIYEGSATPAWVVDSVAAFGLGELVILDYALTPPARGQRAGFERLRFGVCLVWRST